MAERSLRARDIREGMQVMELSSETWLTVTSMLHITAPAKVVSLTFDDGRRAALPPDLAVLVRDAKDGAPDA